MRDLEEYVNACLVYKYKYIYIHLDFFAGKGAYNELYLCYVIHSYLNGLDISGKFTHDTIWNNYKMNKIGLSRENDLGPKILCHHHFDQGWS